MSTVSVSASRGIFLLAFTPSSLRLEVTGQNLLCFLAMWQDQGVLKLFPVSVCLSSGVRD